METLKPVFLRIASVYPEGSVQAEKLWDEIEKAYNHKKRHYHTLTHLENLYAQLRGCKHLITDWDSMLFSLYYHDIVYKASRSDNEEESARLAVSRMEALGVPGEKVERCKAQILATKSHKLEKDPDTDLFTDADLSVLGMDWDSYHTYYEQVRKEYSIYPDMLYKPGRKKVLEHFLSMERIFKTDFFYEKFEMQARMNLARELQLL